MEKLTENSNLFQGHDVTFCVLGTTRDQAGTAEAFRKVDLYMVRDSAIASKQANVPQFNLLTASGANANVWAPDWKMGHVLLYMQVKGLAEQEVIKLKFPRTSIFRPGMLNRPGTSRFFEKYSPVSSLHVGDLAKIMIMDAESSVIDTNTVEEPIFYDSNTLLELAKN